MTCACKIREDFPDPDKVQMGVIVYCPLHAKAPEMLEALRILVDHASETYPHFESERGQAEIASGRALLREIEEASQTAKRGIV